MRTGIHPAFLNISRNHHYRNRVIHRGRPRLLQMWTQHQIFVHPTRICVEGGMKSPNRPLNAPAVFTNRSASTIGRDCSAENEVQSSADPAVPSRAAFLQKENAQWPGGLAPLSKNVPHKMPGRMKHLMTLPPNQAPMPRDSPAFWGRKTVIDNFGSGF
jgi:hypothetical protein